MKVGTTYTITKNIDELNLKEGDIVTVIMDGSILVKQGDIWVDTTWVIDDDDDDDGFKIIQLN
jgi:hypothetical protein